MNKLSADAARLSVTAAGHASGRVPAEAEAKPVVGKSAYRKSTPGRAAPARRAARIKPARATRRPIIAASSGSRKRKLLATSVRTSVRPCDGL